MKTRDLVIETLKKIGCQPEVDDKDNICFKYQGESMYVSADNNFKFVTIWDPWWIVMDLKDQDANLLKEAINMVNLSADCLVDAISFIKGVDEERRFTVLPFIGIGSNINANHKPVSACFSFSTGTQALFRVDKHINLFTELKWSFLGDKIDGYKGGIWCEGSAVLSAGFIYNF